MNREASKALFDEQTKHLEGDLLQVRNWHVFSRTFPVLDVGFEAPGRQPFRVQMQCDDWNELPPAVPLLSIAGIVLTTVPTGPTSIFHQGPHNITGRPFVCMAGTREYHTHSSHTSDLWDNYKTKSGYDLGGILTRIWAGWLKSTP
jgi:hypothetical protein